LVLRNERYALQFFQHSPANQKRKAAHKGTAKIITPLCADVDALRERLGMRVNYF